LFSFLWKLICGAIKILWDILRSKKNLLLKDTISSGCFQEIFNNLKRLTQGGRSYGA